MIKEKLHRLKCTHLFLHILISVFHLVSFFEKTRFLHFCNILQYLLSCTLSVANKWWWKVLHFYNKVPRKERGQFLYQDGLPSFYSVPLYRSRFVISREWRNMVCVCVCLRDQPLTTMSAFQIHIKYTQLENIYKSRFKLLRDQLVFFS